jgi:hypothetical protein
MDESGFVDLLEDNGKKIFTVFEDLVISGRFELVPTGRGFHLCVLKGDRKVKIMQIWPAPKDWLESRIQYMEEEVVLTDDMKHTLRGLLANVGFRPTSGDQGNMRFVFGSQKKRALENSELDKLERNLRSIADLIDGSELRTG